ncbi:MAG: ABC transporter permease [Anaerolineae bacterium]|nr:ABC transporter permease [Anaerolineae bacterium]
MLKFIIGRLIEMVPVLIGISILVFFFIHLIPGDPAAIIAGDFATPESIADIRSNLGLDEPLPVQYFRYMGRLLRGDMGRSIHTSNPIAQELLQRLPASIELAVSAMLIAILIGIPAGIVSAMRRSSILDTLTMTGALIGVSVPIYVLGLVAVWFFAVQLRILPPGSRIGPDIELQNITGFFVLDSILTRNWNALVDVLKHLVIPAVVLCTVPMAIIARITRSSLLEVFSQDYVRTARGKGLSETRVVIRHALKNGMLPVITIIGLQFGVILSGAVLTETIFSWPGIGRWVYEAIQKRDYPIVQGMTLFIGFVFVMSSLIVDAFYTWLDPRVRYD